MSFHKPESRIVRYARLLKEKVDEFLFVFKSLKRLSVIANEPSYYPEIKRKSCRQRKSDLFLWLLKHKDINEYYNCYGMDIKGYKYNNDIMPLYTFIKQRRNQIRTIFERDTFSYEALLSDKFIFNKYFSKVLGERLVTNCVASIFNGELRWHNDPKKHINKDFILKPIGGDSGIDVLKVRYKNDSFYNKNGIVNISTYKNHVIEEYLIQNEKLNILHKYSINTLRIITVMREDASIDVFSVFLRVGVEKDNATDNPGSGGVGIGVNEDGTLKQWALYFKKYGTKTDVHPLSGIKFSNFKVPLYEEALALTKEAHSFIPAVKSIGWDVAITNQCPVLIEGNIDWGLPFAQMTDGPLKEKWNKLFYS